MAWIHTETGDGPYPCDAGEYCGNHVPGHRYPSLWPHETVEQAEAREARYLAKMRFGLPRPCQAWPTVEAAKAAGAVGLYLKASRNRAQWEKQVPTPPELMEPGQEHLYNIDGKPGIVQLEIIT